MATLTFGDRLAAEVERKRSQLVVGLDPRPDLLPVELRGDVTRFCCGIVDAVAPHAVAVKPQLAFFEALGSYGMGAFRETCAYARRAGLLVIADGKRGDIGSTARAYAAAYLEGEEPLADALTVNPWLGRESIEPYLAAARRYGTGIFCIVKTSNAGGDVQDMTLSDGRPAWQARRGARRRLGLGARRRARALGRRRRRRRHPSARRQRGAEADAAGGAAAPGRRRPGRDARPTWRGPSRAARRARSSTRPAPVNYAFREGGDDDFRAAAGAEAARLRDEIWDVSGW